MQKISEDKVERLIELISLKRGLYDKNDKNYKKLDWREKAWREISRTLNESENDCKTAWRSLRDQFHKNWKKMKGSKNVKNRKKSYKFFENLLFLNDTTSVKKKKPIKFEDKEQISVEENVELISQTDKYWPDKSHKEETKTSDEGSERDNLSEQHTEPKLSPPSISEKITYSNNPELEAYKNFLQATVSKLLEPKEDSDGIDKFFSSLAYLVRKYDLNVKQLASLQSSTMKFIVDELERTKSGK